MTTFLHAATQLGITECVMTRYDVDAIVEIVNADSDKSSIDQITVIEITDPLVEEAGNRWAQDQATKEKEDPNFVCVTAIGNNPLDGLALVVKNITAPIAFVLNDWLPGTRGYTLPADEFNYPLERELEIITAGHDASHDVILIEGLSLYERDEHGRPCGEQPIDGWKFSPYENTEFLERLFGATHTIDRNFAGAGSALLVPKNAAGPHAVASETPAPSSAAAPNPIAWNDEKVFEEESAPSLPDAPGPSTSIS